MWASGLVRNLCDRVHNIGSKSELKDALDDASAIEEGINEEDAPLLEWLHFGERRLHRQRADLRRDGEEKLGTIGDLRLDPHVTQHEGDKTFRYG